MFDEDNLTNEMSKLNVDVKKLPLGKLSKKQVLSVLEISFQRS